MTTRLIIAALAITLPLVTAACAGSGTDGAYAYRISQPSNPKDVFRTVTRTPTRPTPLLSSVLADADPAWRHGGAMPGPAIGGVPQRSLKAGLVTLHIRNLSNLGAWPRSVASCGTWSAVSS